MRASHVARWLWPGYLEACERGRWSGLALAVAAAVALNGLLLVSFGWDELIAPRTRAVSWAVLASVWVLAAVVSGRKALGRPELAGSPVSDLFPAALDEYLRGHWNEAEALCDRLLGRDADDLEAQLLVASVYRRTGRATEARRTLDRLETFERAHAWRAEIAVERQLLDETEQDTDTTNDQDSAEPLKRAA